MYKQPEIDFDLNAGTVLAQAGMELAKEHAGITWSEDCWRVFCLWLSLQEKGFEFMLEDFRKYVQENDLLEAPPDPRAYAFLSKRAAKEGLITWFGMGKVKSKHAHCRPSNVWIKL